jgi:hypothetical protein
VNEWSAERCAQLLAKAKRSPTGWKACCPAHEDSDPSLFLADGDDGLALVCYAGCDYKAIAAALEARGAELKHSRDRSQIPQEHFQLGEYHSHWDYRDAAGRIVMRVCRWEQGRGKKDIRPLLRTEDGWKWSHHPVPRPLYQLDRLANDPQLAVLIVEGEKTAVAAQKLFPSYIATTWPGGAAAMGQADIEPLRGRDVVLVPDCDIPGRKAMAWWAQHLKDHARSVRILDPHRVVNSLPESWDLADALAEKRDVSGWLDQALPAEMSSKPERSPPLDWRALESQTPPERLWAIDHWFGRGYVTLLPGDGGTGKTLIGQAMGSCLALRREYLDWIQKEHRVLMWAAEDDADELWRRQIAIARWLKVPLSDFADRLVVHSYDGREVALAGLFDQRLVETSMLAELREQIGDYKAEVVVLDNIARLYAGNENDRHQVTSFIAMLTAAGMPTKAAILLLGHPGKARGSEYSGSTAWEGAVRARLFLGRTLPDAKEDQPDEPSEDDGVRYLCRRKANYSARDWRRLTFRDGVMVPDAAPEATAGQPLACGGEYACDVVTRAVRKLAGMTEYGVASSNSPKYLPRLAREYKLLDRLTEKQFAATMRVMRGDGRLVMVVVGRYPNRSPREGLTLPEVHS